MLGAKVSIAQGRDEQKRPFARFQKLRGKDAPVCLARLGNCRQGVSSPALPGSAFQGRLPYDIPDFTVPRDRALIGAQTIM
jgi:hypothetical protein